MPSESHAIVWASLAADALALGAHWIYDTRQIDQQVGRMTTLQAPLPSSFHKNRKRGDLTHYGDQTTVLLQSIVEAGGFSLTAFARAWQRYFADYDGYRDHATKTTLQRMEAGMPLEEAGSASSDLAGAARIAPLVHYYCHDEDAMVTSVRQQTALTHRNPDVIDSADYLARVALRAIQGQDPQKALQDVRRQYFDRPPFDRWVAEGIESRGGETRVAIGRFGQACNVAAAFPGVVHLIAKYHADPVEGLIENVMAGGDSAARGMLAGMVFGAFSGLGAISEQWLTGMNQSDLIEKKLAAFPTPA